MSGLDWSRIRDGREFEALVGALVVHLHSDARPFGQPGPDGGVDVLHAETVYQAKFRREWSPSELERVARDELEKIRGYRVPGHRHHALWRDITRWVLMTNGPRGNAANARWQGIADAFAQIGLTAEWCSRDDIEPHIANTCPGLRLAFFEGHRRLFLHLAEAWPALAEADLADHPNWSLPPVGADSHRLGFSAFLDDADARFCVVTGPGGVGKTRLLWQLGRDALGQGDRDVYWVDPETLAHAAAWYTHVIPERPALLLLDEPSPAVLAQLDREATLRAKWKIALTARSEHEAVVCWFDARRGKRGRGPTMLALAPLDGEDAVLAAARIAGCSPDGAEARRIAEAAQGFPIWMLIAAQLRAAGVAPPDPDALARAYVDAVFDGLGPHGNRAQMKAVLRRLALIQPVNVEDEADVAWLAEQVDADVPAVIGVIERLANAELIFARGRLRAVRPDVVRDWLLRDWLVDGRRAEGRSAAGELLVGTFFESPSARPLLGRLIRGLSRVELVCRLGRAAIEVSFLDRIEALTVETAQTDAADAQLAALRHAESMRASRPRVVARVARELRQREIRDTLITSAWGERTLGRRDVLGALPEAIFDAAGYVIEAREQRFFLREMMAFVALETDLKAHQQPGGAPWSVGGQPSALLPRMLGDQKGWLADFTKAADTEAHRRLTALGGADPISGADVAILSGLLEPLTNVRFEHNEVQGDQWIITWGVRPVAHPFWARRAALMDTLWQLTGEPAAAPENRAHAWRFIDRTHGQTIQHAAKAPQLGALLGDDLERAAERLEGPIPTPRERIIARALWRWHLQYTDDVRHRAAAERCERAVWQHARLAPFELLVTAEWDAVGAAAQAVVDGLGAADADALAHWFDDAFRFFGEEAAGRWTPAVAWRLGGGWRDAVFECAHRLACGPDVHPRLAGRIYWRRLAALRAADKLDVARSEINALLAAARDNDARRLVLVDLFTYSDAARDATQTELGWFADWQQYFEGAPTALPLYLQIVGGLWAVDPARFAELAARAWDGLAHHQRGETLEGLFGAITVAGDPASDAGRSLAEWLEARLFEVPDMDRFFIGTRRRRGKLEHNAGRALAPTLGRMSWSELADRLAYRAQIARELAESEADDPFDRWRTLPQQFDLSLLVDPKTASAEATEALLCVFCTPPVDATVVLSAPAHCGTLDPGGDWLPLRITARVRAVAPDAPSEALFWPARLAKGWPEGSPPWRRIAEAVCAWADAQDDDKPRQSAWAELYDGNSGMLWGADGLLRHYEGHLPTLEAHRDAEVDPLLRDYWAWRADNARRRVEAERRRLEEGQLR